jgi:hypothetical protein
MSALPIPSKPLDPSSRYVWPTLILGALALVLGTIGFWISDGRIPGYPGWSEALYSALQLFMLRMPNLPGGTNLFLEVARWLAAVLSEFVILYTLYHVLIGDLRRFRLQWAKKHVVVCGLGEVGKRLAIEFRKAKYQVAAIERGPAAPGVAEVASHGITVVFGDAMNPNLLRRVRAHYAKYVLAVCSEDDTNTAIALAVKQLDKGKKSDSAGTECLLLMADPHWREWVKQRLDAGSETGRFRIKVGGLDVPDMVARRVFEEHPFDFDGIQEQDSYRVHLVVIGTCCIANAIAVKALQLCHFANRSRLLLSVVGKDAAEFIARLQQQHLYAEPWYDVQAIELAPGNISLPQKVTSLAAADQFLTVAICSGYEDGRTADAESRIAMLADDIATALKDSFAAGVQGQPIRSQVLACLRHKAGLGKLVEAVAQSGNKISIHAFGLVETFCNRDVLLHEKQDTIAEALHKDYLIHHKGNAWEILEEELRDSNRLAADHIPIKLRALGLCLADKGRGKPAGLEIFELANDKNKNPSHMLMLLSEMEHNRWCAERWLIGWRLGQPKDKAERYRLKINADLVPWANLPEQEKRKDWEQIHAIPDAVDKANKMIVLKR